MATTNTTVAYQILDSVVNALKPIGVKTYLLNRPKSVDDKLDAFIVVDLPVRIRRPVYGSDRFRFVTTCVLYAFCRAQTDGTPNINRQTEFVRSITDLFPMTDERIEGVNPGVQLRGLDEYNFQVTTITFTLRTKTNALGE